MKMNSIGSIWRKWDLHIHTPASFQWSGKHLHQQNADERQATCQAIIDKINSLDIDAFCIMDYWTFDGYFAIEKYLERFPDATTKRIFPGIELRLEAPTDFRLNTHVLFDDSVLEEQLEHFLAHLAISGLNGTPPSRQGFIDLAKTYDGGKLNEHGYRTEDKANDDKMFEVGIKTAVITRESLQNAVKILGEDRCLIIQPYDTSDGLEKLDWKDHPSADSALMKMAHVFETRKPVNVALFLGLGHSDKPDVGEQFIDNLGGRPKPVVSGSDAHAISKYGDYPSKRITWLKAQPTFAGLRQVCHEPALRCFIGESPPKQEHVAQNPTKYMQRLQIEKLPDSELADCWFDGTSIELNPGLIAIIGNKGTGKSALADILALAGNTHCLSLEFLNSKRFRYGTDISRNFKASLTWCGGNSTEITLDKNPSLDHPERVRYLPQQFIESLCNEIESGGSKFERELKKVIFSHVSQDERLHKGSLDELINYKAQAHRDAISQLQGKLHTLNTEIVSIESQLSEETINSYRSALSLKQNELTVHQTTRPKEMAAPTPEGQTAAELKTASDLSTAQADLANYIAQIEPLKTERSSAVAKIALLTRLNGHIDNFENAYATFLEENEAEFDQVALILDDIVSLTINRAPITTLLANTNNRLVEISTLIIGTDQQNGLDANIQEITTRILQLQSDLGARQREYQAYLGELNRWQNRLTEIEGSPDIPDTIQFLCARIKATEETLPESLETLRIQRRQNLLAIHAELLKIRDVYEQLYKPVQQIVAESSEFAKEQLRLDFNAFLAITSFEENFFDYIHRGRVGNFYGEEESKKTLQKLLTQLNFNSSDDAIEFLDDLMKLLTTIDRGSGNETINISSQLKTGKDMVDFYDFVAGLSYLEPRYTLRLGDKDISQLSPGEKGALLLVFYLLLDPEEIPIIVDQPEQNLDNESVVVLLVDCIRKASSRRQVVIVTHNPNLAVVCDADQVICCHLDKANGNRASYECGAIEDNPINKATVNVLEGTYRAFDNRRRKYHKP